MVDIDYILAADFDKFLHDALDCVEQHSIVEEFHAQFDAIRYLVSSVQPWLTEAYFASRFVYGLRRDIQNYVIQSCPITVLDAFRLACVYEYNFSNVYDANDIVIIPVEKTCTTTLAMQDTPLAVQQSDMTLQDAMLFTKAIPNAQPHGEVITEFVANMVDVAALYDNYCTSAQSSAAVMKIKAALSPAIMKLTAAVMSPRVNSATVVPRVLASAIRYDDFHQVLDKGGTTLQVVHTEFPSPTHYKVVPSVLPGATAISHPAAIMDYIPIILWEGYFIVDAIQRGISNILVIHLWDHSWSMQATYPSPCRVQAGYAAILQWVQSHFVGVGYYPYAFLVIFLDDRGFLGAVSGPTSSQSLLWCILLFQAEDKGGTMSFAFRWPSLIVGKSFGFTVALPTLAHIEDIATSFHHVSSQGAITDSKVVRTDLVALVVYNGRDSSSLCVGTFTADTLHIPVLYVPHSMAANTVPAQRPTVSNHSFVTTLSQSMSIPYGHQPIGSLRIVDILFLDASLCVNNKANMVEAFLKDIVVGIFHYIHGDFVDNATLPYVVQWGNTNNILGNGGTYVQCSVAALYLLDTNIVMSTNIVLPTNRAFSHKAPGNIFCSQGNKRTQHLFKKADIHKDQLSTWTYRYITFLLFATDGMYVALLRSCSVGYSVGGLGVAPHVLPLWIEQLDEYSSCFPPGILMFNWQCSYAYASHCADVYYGPFLPTDLLMDAMDIRNTNPNLIKDSSACHSSHGFLYDINDLIVCFGILHHFISYVVDHIRSSSCFSAIATCIWYVPHDITDNLFSKGQASFVASVTPALIIFLTKAALDTKSVSLMVLPHGTVQGFTPLANHIDPRSLTFRQDQASGAARDQYKGTPYSQEVALIVIKPERVNASIQNQFVPNVVQSTGLCIRFLLLFKPVIEMLLLKLANINCIATRNLLPSCSLNSVRVVAIVPPGDISSALVYCFPSWGIFTSLYSAQGSLRTDLFFPVIVLAPGSAPSVGATSIINERWVRTVEVSFLVFDWRTHLLEWFFSKNVLVMVPFSTHFSFENALSEFSNGILSKVHTIPCYDPGLSSLKKLGTHSIFYISVSRVSSTLGVFIPPCLIYVKSLMSFYSPQIHNSCERHISPVEEDVCLEKHTVTIASSTGHVMGYETVGWNAITTSLLLYTNGYRCWHIAWPIATCVLQMQNKAGPAAVYASSEACVLSFTYILLLEVGTSVVFNSGTLPMPTLWALVGHINFGTTILMARPSFQSALGSAFVAATTRSTYETGVFYPVLILLMPALDQCPQIIHAGTASTSSYF